MDRNRRCYRWLSSLLRITEKKMLPRLGKHLIFHDNGYVFQVMAEILWGWPRSLSDFKRHSLFALFSGCGTRCAQTSSPPDSRRVASKSRLAESQSRGFQGGLPLWSQVRFQPYREGEAGSPIEGGLPLEGGKRSCSPSKEIREG